jgi:hypothetical protein
MKWLPWTMAAMWLIARYIVRQFVGMSVENAHTFGVLSNVLLIVILVFVAIYYAYKQDPGLSTTFFTDFKVCMKQAMKYVIGSVIAMALYYAVLCPQDLTYIRDTRVSGFNDMIQSDEGFSAFKAEHPELKEATREILIQKNNENVEKFVTVKMQLSLGLLGLTAVSLCYSLLATFFYRMFAKRI